jgi:hypothetical protein
MGPQILMKEVSNYIAGHISQGGLKFTTQISPLLNYNFRILLFYCTCPNFGDKKERVLILYTFRAVSIDFSFLSPIWYGAIKTDPKFKWSNNYKLDCGRLLIKW